MQILRGGAITVLPAAFGICLLIGTALAIAAPATELQILATDPAPACCSQLQSSGSGGGARGPMTAHHAGDKLATRDIEISFQNERCVISMTMQS